MAHCQTPRPGNAGPLRPLIPHQAQSSGSRFLRLPLYLFYACDAPVVTFGKNNITVMQTTRNIQITLICLLLN